MKERRSDQVAVNGVNSNTFETGDDAVISCFCYNKNTSNYSEGNIPRGVLAYFLPKSRDIQGKMPSPKVIWNAF